MRLAPPTLPWTHHITFPENLYSVAFAPDSRSIYIHQRDVISIDLWPIFIRQWPETVGVLLVLLTVIIALLILRIFRRPQIALAPHCRRCNYNLSGQPGVEISVTHARFGIAAGTLCPECGTDIVRCPPRRGRSRGRRIAPHLLIWTTLVSTFLANIILVPRQGRLSTAFDWSSSRIVPLAERYGIEWLTSHKRTADRILQVDLETGRTLRTVATRRTRSKAQLVVSPDGKVLFLPGDPNTIDAISSRTGRRLASVELPGSTREFGSVEPVVVGFGRNPQEVVVEWEDHEVFQAGLVLWDHKRGTVRRLIDGPPYRVNSSGSWARFARGFVVIDHDPLRLLAFPNGLPAALDGSGEGALPFRIYTLGHDEPRPVTSVWPGAAVAHPTATSPCGSTLYCIASLTRIVGLDLRTGGTTEFKDIHAWYRASPYVAVARDGQTIAVHLYPRSLRRPPAVIALYSVPDARELAHLAIPPDLINPHFAFAPDGRWMAGRCQPEDQNLRMTAQLVLWRLDALTADHTSTPRAIDP